jgi:two-component system sensor histidine kinase YesM
LKETENAKRKQEIRALQAQINPHFLYNCLNSISMFAMLRDYGKIREMMVSLLSLLRYSMEHLEQTVALKRELDYLGHYTRMMQLRYSRPFRLEIEVDPALDSMKIPKLLLQPLMENALFHGVLASEPGREGLIRVAAGYADDGRSVQLLVADNGAGMEPGRLKRIRTLLSEPSNPDNIGLRNVWERLKLVFGPQASLDIESEAGTGTTIRISLPADQVIMESEATTNDV